MKAERLWLQYLLENSSEKPKICGLQESQSQKCFHCPLASSDLLTLAMTP